MKDTHEFLSALLIECQNDMDFRDWDFKLYTTPKPPKDMRRDGDFLGLAQFDPERLTGKVWIGLAECKKAGECPAETLIHEMAHIFEEHRDEEYRCTKIARWRKRILFNKAKKRIG
jgi:hypothetical protein